jgi:CubicO group peptidase (beta-lactamase class C family)
MFRGCLLVGILTLASPAVGKQDLIEPGNTPGQDVTVMVDHGLDKALSALPALVAETLGRSGVPGAAVAVVHGGKTIYAEGFGVREIGKPAGIDTNTVFQIASLSKSLSASVTATQVTKGIVGWNDPVVRHLPGFRLNDPYVTLHATIGDFMAHRTGLPPAAGDDLEDMGFNREQILERLRLLPLDAFRSSYHYANFGTTTGAEAVAAAAGKPWEDLAEDALFKPLGMTSTSARHAVFIARENRALLHVLEDGKFQPLYDRDPDAQAPAGGVSSTVTDLAEWMKFLLAGGRHNGEPLASPASLVEALNPHAFSAPAQTLDERAGFYGYGFNVRTNPNGRTSFSHSGAFLLGAGTNFQIVPSADVGIVVLTNGSPVGAAESISAAFLDIVQYGEPLRDWYAGYHAVLAPMLDPVGDLAGKTPPVAPHAPKALDLYAGRYDSTYYGPAEVAVEDDHLVLTLGPRPVRYVLAHWDGDTFALSPQGENAAKGSRSSVRFDTRDGKPEAFTIEYLNASKMAVWER